MITSHRVPDEQFDELARGDGGPPAVGTLLAGQLSKRVLQICLLLQLAARGAATIREQSSAEQAFAALAAVQEVAPDSAEQILLYPPVGAWAAHCVARLRPGADRSDLSTVSATEAGLGQLGAIAASAAVLAFTRAEAPLPTGLKVTVPMRDGRVVLPMLGRATFNGTPQHGTATFTIDSTGGRLESAGRTVGLPADPAADGPGWRALRHLRTSAGGQDLTVCLDDEDPFREYSGLEIAFELPDETIATWESALTQAWSLLTAHHQELARTLSCGLVSLVPLIDPKDGRGVSATAVNAFGAAAMTPPVDGATLAVGLIHEFQHSKLSALLDLIPLYDRDTQVLLYAPWRDDPRPLPGLLQGAYAYLGVTSFWRRHRYLVTDGESTFAHFQFARWREQSARAVDAIAASGSLTEAGHRFVSGMRAVLADWSTEPVPAAAISAANEATLDHWLTWRLRNLSPEAGGVAALATDRLAGAAPPVGPAPGTIPIAGRFDPLMNDRLVLLHQRLRRSEDDPQQTSPGVRSADLEYIEGHFAAAASGYREEIDQQPDAAAYAWAGLALCLRQSADRSSNLLCRRPELVAAVHRSIRDQTGTAVDPAELADWLSDLEPAG